MEYLSNLIEKPVSGEWGDEGNKIPVIRSTNFTMDGFLDLSDVKFRDIDESKIAKKKLQRGDIIIEKSGGSLDQPVGRVVFFDEEGDFLFSNFTSALRPKQDKVFPKYLNYMLLSAYKGNITSYFQNRTTGIINLQLTRYVDELQIPLPPLPTQQKIAAALDKADAIRKRSQLILSKYDQLAQSVFLEMFGDPVKNEKGWRKDVFGSHIGLLTDYHANGSYETLSKHVTLKDTKDFALMVRTTDLEQNNFTKGVKYIDEHAYNFLKKSKVFGNEIIINKIGSAGNVYLMPNLNRPVSLGMNAFMIRLKETANIKFIYFSLISSHGEKEIKKRVKGAVTKTIRKDAIREIPMMMPPIDLQNQFSTIIAQIEKQKAQTQLELDRAEELFQSLLQRAFTGELFPETSPKELTHT
jgi:type I restriction enzyme S subunit